MNRRNQELPVSDFKDVDRAWDSFNQNYRFASSDERSLFDLDDEPQQNSTSDKMQILQPAPRSNARPHKRVLRTAGILAAVIAVLLATSLTSYALGIRPVGLQSPAGQKRHLVSGQKNTRKSLRRLLQKRFQRL